MAFEIKYIDKRGAGWVCVVPTAERMCDMIKRLWRRRIDATAYCGEFVVGESRKMDGKWIWWCDPEAEDC